MRFDDRFNALWQKQDSLGRKFLTKVVQSDQTKPDEYAIAESYFARHVDPIKSP